MGGWETTDIPFIATRLSLIPSAKSRKRTVVITQGADPTIVAHNGFTKEHGITPLPKEELVDTNGAGDAYVGGFLAALSKGKSVEECCKAGAYSAGVIVQHSVHLPSKTGVHLVRSDMLYFSVFQ